MTVFLKSQQLKNKYINLKNIKMSTISTMQIIFKGIITSKDY